VEFTTAPDVAFSDAWNENIRVVLDVNHGGVGDVCD